MSFTEVPRDDFWNLDPPIDIYGMTYPGPRHLDLRCLAPDGMIGAESGFYILKH